MNNDEDFGLVISSKTGRKLEEIAVGIASGEVAPVEDQSTYHVVLSPGSIRLKRKSQVEFQKSPNYVSRNAITGWSRKSRANMVARFASLDYSPMLVDPNRLAVMITLTYPGDWLAVAPTAKHSKKHLQAFRKQFERKYESAFNGLWKAEFQRRGAVHFHIFCVAPIEIQNFRKWVAVTWASIVNHPNKAERAKHLAAGTAVDIAPGGFIGDTRLIAMYFSKHSSPSFGIKNYQNSPPIEWVEKGSVGRFWGYWNLKPLEVDAQITEQELVLIARLLRKWFRSKRFIRKVRVMRANSKGVVRYRNVKRRSSRLGGSYGFIVLEDTERMAGYISRYLELNRGSRSRETL